MTSSNWVIFSDKSFTAKQTLAISSPICKATSCLHNSHTEIQIVDRRLDEQELIALANEASVIVDCTDNFDTRHLVNIACVKTRTPLVSAAAIRFEGQLMIWDPAVPNSPVTPVFIPLTSQLK